MKNLISLLTEVPVKNSLSEKIISGILKSYSVLLLFIFLFSILIFTLLNSKIEKYTCNYLSSTSELLGYQLGRELALKNNEVALELINQHSQSIKSVIPGTLLDFSISSLNNKKSNSLDNKWHCILVFNHIEFEREIRFGELKAGILKGVIKLYEGWFFSLLFILFILCATFVIYSSGNYIYKLFSTHVLSPLKSIVNSSFDQTNADLTSEMKEIISRIIDSHNKLIDSEKKISAANSQLELSNLASQVSHDIKSPIAALNMVLGQIESLPEQTRVIIRSSVHRINDIANSLLNHGKKQRSNDIVSRIEPLQNTLLASLIDEIVSEKRIEFRQASNVQIEAHLQSSYGLFAIMNPIEMKRLLSNAINNSIESFEHKQGVIEVILSSLDEEIHLIVKDNGKGIPAHILEKLGQRGMTNGKEGTQSGSGLGVYHAKMAIESFGGKYEIQSEEGTGTSVMITLKKEAPPRWFVQKIDLNSKKYIVATDDDNSILQVWQEKFSKFVATNKIELVTCTSGNCLKEWVANNEVARSNTLFLIDYELIGQKQTGLDLIEELSIEANAILVSSRFEEPVIKDRCNKLGVKMIPKGMASLVSIELKNKSQKPDQTFFEENLHINHPNSIEGVSNENSNKKIRYDLCLIDDDTQLIHRVWGLVAESNGLNIKMFSTPQAFLAAVHTIDRRTPIYVDVSLGDGVNGIDFSYEINKLGFIEINLATGHAADSIVAPPFISRIVGKDPVF